MPTPAIAALLPYALPLLLEIIDQLSPEDAEAVLARLNEAVDRRLAAVRRNEELDVPRDDAGWPTFPDVTLPPPTTKRGK